MILTDILLPNKRYYAIQDVFMYVLFVDKIFKQSFNYKFPILIIPILLCSKHKASIST